MNASMDWSLILKERTQIENFRNQRFGEDICALLRERERERERERIERSRQLHGADFHDSFTSVLICYYRGSLY